MSPILIENIIKIIYNQCINKVRTEQYKSIITAKVSGRDSIENNFNSLKKDRLYSRYKKNI